MVNNAKTLAPDRCEQYCETIGGTWKNADERENWVNLNPFDVNLKRDSLLGLETTCWFNDVPVPDPPPPERACKTKWWPIESEGKPGKKPGAS